MKKKLEITERSGEYQVKFRGAVFVFTTEKTGSVTKSVFRLKSFYRNGNLTNPNTLDAYKHERFLEMQKRAETLLIIWIREKSRTQSSA